MLVITAIQSGAQEAPSVEEVLETEETTPQRLPTTLIARWTRDNNDNDVYGLIVDQPFSSAYSGSLRAGHVDLVSGNDRFRFEYGGIGATWQPSRLGVTLSFDIWGDIDVLRNRDFNGAMFYQGEKWDWDIRLQHRVVDTKLNFTLPDGRVFSGSDQTFSDSWGGTAYYKLLPNWSVYAGGNDYDYETNLEAVNLAFSLQLLSLQSVVLAAQYQKWNVQLGTDFRFGPRQLGFRYTVDQPVFGPLKSRTYAMNFSFPIGKRFRVALNVGIRKNIDGFIDNTKFGVFSLITRL